MDFEKEFFERARKKSGRWLAGGVIDVIILLLKKLPQK
jgi:hypothetical protein